MTGTVTIPKDLYITLLNKGKTLDLIKRKLGTIDQDAEVLLAIVNDVAHNPEMPNSLKVEANNALERVNELYSILQEVD